MNTTTTKQQKMLVNYIIYNFLNQTFNTWEKAVAGMAENKWNQCKIAKNFLEMAYMFSVWLFSVTVLNNHSLDLVY